MKRTVLLFPNASAIADFVLENEVNNAEVNSREQKLTAELTDQEIALACTQFGAVVISMLPSDYALNAGLNSWRLLR